MKKLYNDYLQYELPSNWCTEEDGEQLFIYHPNGSGAIVASFYYLEDSKKMLEENISVMAKKFVDQNKISLFNPFILYTSKDDQSIIYGSGTTEDNWFVKLWIIAKYPRVMVATYNSEKETDELKKCDTIIKSMRFI